MVLQVLLVHHAAVDINGTSANWGPLHLLGYYGHPTVARVLLEHGADVNIRSRAVARSMQDGRCEGSDMVYIFTREIIDGGGGSQQCLVTPCPGMQSIENGTRAGRWCVGVTDVTAGCVQGATIIDCNKFLFWSSTNIVL
jgi:hypothetical protein